MVRIRDSYPEVVRIILTGYTDQEVVIKAINQGEVYRFLTKPWDDDELCTTVSDALKHAAVARHSQQELEQQLNRVDIETVMALAETIELKDPYTKGHCSRVRDYSYSECRKRPVRF